MNIRKFLTAIVVSSFFIGCGTIMSRMLKLIHWDWVYVFIPWLFLVAVFLFLFLYAIINFKK